MEDVEVTTRIDYKWRVVRPMERDEVQILVVRYHCTVENGDVKVDRSEYLDRDGRWNEYPPMGEIRPALVIPAILLVTLERAPARILEHEAVKLLISALRDVDDVRIEGGHITIPTP